MDSYDVLIGLVVVLTFPLPVVTLTALFLLYQLDKHPVLQRWLSRHVPPQARVRFQSLMSGQHGSAMLKAIKQRCRMRAIYPATSEVLPHIDMKR